MSISRIDLNGNLLRTNDVSQIKANEDNKVFSDQNAFQTEFNKETDQKANSVNRKDNASGQEKEKHDAKEKGKNEYVDQRDKKRKKKQQEPQDRVIAKSVHGFDMKI